MYCNVPNWIHPDKKSRFHSQPVHLGHVFTVKNHFVHTIWSCCMIFDRNPMILHITCCVNVLPLLISSLTVSVTIQRSIQPHLHSRLFNFPPLTMSPHHIPLSFTYPYHSFPDPMVFRGKFDILSQCPQQNMLRLLHWSLSVSFRRLLSTNISQFYCWLTEVALKPVVFSVDENC